MTQPTNSSRIFWNTPFLVGKISERITSLKAQSCLHSLNRLLFRSAITPVHGSHSSTKSIHWAQQSSRVLHLLDPFGTDLVDVGHTGRKLNIPFGCDTRATSHQASFRLRYFVSKLRNQLSEEGSVDRRGHIQPQNMRDSGGRHTLSIPVGNLAHRLSNSPA